MPSHFPCSPLIRKWSQKKTQIEKIFNIGSFLQMSEEVPTPTINKSKKKEGGKNKTKNKWTFLLLNENQQI